MFRRLTGLSAVTLLFAIAMNWCMKHATNPENYVKDAGLKHTEHSRLTEWHFPGDMALVDDTVGGLQIMTDSVVC